MLGGRVEDKGLGAADAVAGGGGGRGQRARCMRGEQRGGDEPTVEVEALGDEEEVLLAGEEGAASARDVRSGRVSV